MVDRKLDPLKPSDYHVAGFTVFLATKFMSPASLSEVMDLGTWLSSAVHAYVPKPLIQKASLALGTCFGARAKGTGHRTLPNPK